MNSTISGVIIGALVTVVGNFLQSVFFLWKEKRDWDQKQKQEATAWRRSLEKDESSVLRESYQNAIYSLSIVMADAQVGVLSAQKSESLREALKWIAQVCLRHPSQELEEKVGLFLNTPEHYAGELRYYIIQLARAEKNLFVSDRLQIDEPPSSLRNKDRRVAKFKIDAEYRRQQFVEGRDLPVEVAMRYSLRKLTNSQRLLLLDSLPSSDDLLPSEFWLPMPVKDRKGNLVRDGATWMAKTLIVLGKEHEIFKSWEQDYNQALSELEKAKVQSS